MRLHPDSPQMLEALPAGVAILDQGYLTYLNPCARKILGLETEPLPIHLPSTSWKLRSAAGPVLPAGNLSLESLDKEIGRTCQVIEIELSPERRVVLSVRANPLPERDGRCPGSLVVFSDITEEHDREQARRRDEEHHLRRLAAEAEEALQEAQQARTETLRAKSEFLANISHEIRTPMTIFMGSVELVLHSRLTNQQRQYLQMAQGAAENLLSLIEDILDYAKIESGKLVLARKAFDLRQCVTEAVGGLSEAARQKHLTLSLDFSGELPEQIVGDSVRLGQVLTKLIGNAVKFTERGWIRVRVEAEEAGKAGMRRQELAFYVEDTGIGIPQSKMDHLFKVFSQADSSPTRKYGGTGLGLAFCGQIVEWMGGSIGVESREGEGSTFFFTIPSQAVQAPHTTPSEKAPAFTRAGRILVVEDDPMVRELVELLFRRRGYRVETEVNGLAAVRRHEIGDFDLILMDLQMPEMDGIEATRLIRRRESVTGGHIPIIALTAHARSEDRDLCLAAGMDDFLAKPLKNQDLFAAVERHLGRLPRPMELTG